jgi:hypothetical protein
MGGLLMKIRYKKGISIILVMLMVLGGLNGLLIGGERVHAAEAFAGGTGTIGNPYLIATPEQLNEVRYHVDPATHFKLIDDVDFEDYIYPDGNDGWLPIAQYTGGKYFRGSLDGNGYKIKNLMINRPEMMYTGLFGMITATLTNVALEGVHVTGGFGTGALVGVNVGFINNSSVTGAVYGLGTNTGGMVGTNYRTIKGSSSSANVYGAVGQTGGLVGSNDTEYGLSGIIINSYATGDVEGVGGFVGGLVGINGGVGPYISNSYATGNVSGSHRIGGLVGDNRAPISNSFATGNVTGGSINGDIGGLAGFNISAISNSYARGDVSGAVSKVGGLVGYNSELGSVSNSYATGSVGGTTTHIGGLIGLKDGTGAVSDSFYDWQTTGQLDLGMGRLTTEMIDPSTYSDANWDFVNIWGIQSARNNGYPYLYELPSTAIDGVTAPVKGETPITLITSNEYTASVAWSDAPSTFAASTVYTATITLTPKTGYTLTGIIGNYFNVDGATTTNAANSNAITAVFPATEALSSMATLTSTIGIVSTDGTAAESITSIPWDTKVHALKQAITPAANATFEIYNADGTTVATTLATGKKVIVTAEDTTTKVTYTLTMTSAPPSEDPELPTTVPTTVTSTNGSITLPIGRPGRVSLADEVTVTIPAGATNKDMQLTITQVLDTQSLLTNEEALASPIYEILKNFPENFTKPVTLTFVFDPASLHNDDRVAVFYYDEEKSDWVEIGGKVSGNKITVDVDHFTKFAVMVVGQAVEVPVEDTTTISFSDISGHWAEANIRQAVSSGIVKGYVDGTFKPNHTVTRAEFSVMLMNAWKAQGEGVELTFKDSALIRAWAKKAVAQAVQAGIITGYTDGTFGPNAEITRAEMATMVAKALEKPIEMSTVTGFADDKDIPVWAKGSIAYMNQSGIMQGKGNNVFAPQDHATRAEAVTVMLEVIEQLKNDH